MLHQEQDGRLRALGYASRTLSPAEKNYHMYIEKLDFLALKWVITERFRDCLHHATSYTVYSHTNVDNSSAVGYWWVTELADFNFSIKYRPGNSNIDMAVLSRLSLDPTNTKNTLLQKWRRTQPVQQYKRLSIREKALHPW